MQVFVLFLVLVSCRGVKIDLSEDEVTSITPTTAPTTIPTTTPTTTAPTTISSTSSSSVAPSLSTTPSTTKNTIKHSSSTLGPPTTTVLPKNVSESNQTTEIQPVGRRKSLSERNFCKCDTNFNLCDSNCCCDLDCSQEALKAFDCGGEEVTLVDFYVARGLEDCKVSGGLFCVVRSNYDEKERNFYDASKLDEAKKYQWPRMFQQPDQLEFKDNYRVGDIIYIYEENQEKIVQLEIPKSLTQSDCHVLDSIRWLQDERSSCLRSSSEEALQFTSVLLDQLTRSKFFHGPVPLIMEYHCMADNCRNITIFHCLRNRLNCTSVVLNPFSDAFAVQIDFEFHHNFTHLQDLRVYFGYDPFDEDEKVRQEVRVTFKATSGGEHFQVSGPLGYLTRKPLLISKLISLSNSTEEFQPLLLDFFVFYNGSKPYDANRTLMAPTSQNGRCNGVREAINFGENSFVRCNLALDELSETQNITKASNFTHICIVFQEKIFETLIGDILTNVTNYNELNLYVSELGNPRNETKFWKRLQLKNSPTNPVLGVSQIEESGTFSCKNMIINAKYEFNVAKLRVGQRKSQNVLKGASLELGPRVKLEFRLQDDASLLVPLHLQTQFYDLTVRNFGFDSMKVFFATIVLIAITQTLMYIYSLLYFT